MNNNWPKSNTTRLYYGGIVHRKVTLYWPQANSEVERFNRTVEKAIRAANLFRTNISKWKILRV